MKTINIITCILMLFVISGLSAQENYNKEINFTEKAISFEDHTGLEFKLSEPFLRFQKWDTEQTGQSWFSVAMEFSNKSEKSVASFAFKVVAKDKKGNVLYNGLNSCGPMTFSPDPGNKMDPGYIGVYDAFFSKDKDLFKTFKEIKIELTEVNYISNEYPDKPVFKCDTITFDEFQGLSFQVSEPYMYLDDMSGSQLFAIALKFKNSSGKSLKAINFKVTVFDEIGPLYEQEIREHNRKFTPEPKNFNDPNFPFDYEGIDMKFYVHDKSLFKSFTKINIQLTGIE